MIRISLANISSAKRLIICAVFAGLGKIVYPTLLFCKRQIMAYDILEPVLLPDDIQLTLVISTSLISNNRLSRSENLVPVLTRVSNNRYHYTVERAISLLHNIFNISLNLGVKLHIHLLNVVVRFIVFLNSANRICRGTDISNYFRQSLGLRDNENRLI